MKTTKTVIVALGLLIGGLAQAEIFDDFSLGNLMDNWSTTSTDTGLKWTIKDGVLAFTSASAHPGTATYVSRKQDFKLVGTPEKPLVVFIRPPLSPVPIPNPTPPRKSKFLSENSHENKRTVSNSPRCAVWLGIGPRPREHRQPPRALR